VQLSALDLQLVIMMPSQTNGLMSLTYLTKNVIISVITPDVSIQATGMPIWNVSMPYQKCLE